MSRLLTRTLQALLLLGSLTGFHDRARAAPGRTPIPRVELGTHTGFIYKMAVDGAGKYLVTVGDDKTARVWDAHTGTLLYTFRVPIEEGHEGQLYAAAVTRNGKVAAVAGYTGSYLKQSIVYFFDPATGQHRSAIATTADSAVENLAFSGDGRYLAVCLAEGRGVQIYDLQSRALVRSDARMQDKILGAAFSPSGDFAITTYDGYLWLFRAASGYQADSVKLTGAGKPTHVQFSPDGNELAVGFDAAPAFSIIDSQLLRETVVQRLPDDAAQRDLHVVEWSADGEYIYAGGESNAGFGTAMYRFPAHGRGKPEKVAVAERRFADIRRLPGGAMAFVTVQPEVGVLEASGRARWRIRAPTLDLRKVKNEFRVSRSGDSVAFGGGDAPALRFQVLQPPESALSAEARVVGGGSVEDDPPGWNIALADDGERVTVHGIPVALQNRERVKVQAFAPDGKSVIFGTAWSLRRVDMEARQLWSVALAGDVSLVKTTADGRTVVAALADGTIRWYRMEDGKEILALFVNRNGKDWIAWIPSGYYMSSTAGDNFIGWQINQVNRADQEPEFYRAIQFERVLYRPDIVQAYFKSRGFAAQGSGVPELEAMLPPQLDVTVVSAGDKARLHITAVARTLPMQDWSLAVNGIPVIAGASLASAEQKQFTRDLEVALAQGVNHIQVESMAISNQAQSLGEADAYVSGSSQAPKAAPGKLYILAIGVSKFIDSTVPTLRYAADDAAEVAATFANLAIRAGYRDVNAKVLLNDAATSTSIPKSLQEFLSGATADDAVIVFMASHGLSDKQGNYFFVPYDASGSDIRRLDIQVAAAPSLLRWNLLVDQLRHAAGRRLLIVDTCSSGALNGSFDAHSLAKRSMSANFAFMAAAGTHEESQELADAKHGLFTYGLLQALQRGYDPDHDGVVSLTESFQYAFNLVQERRNMAKGPQTHQLTAPAALASMKLAPAGPQADTNKAARWLAKTF
jgi:hypothetical protein